MIITTYQVAANTVYGYGFPSGSPWASQVALNQLEVSPQGSVGVLQLGYLQGASYPADAVVVASPETTSNGPISGDLGLRVYSTASAVLHPLTEYVLPSNNRSICKPPDRLAGYFFVWSVSVAAIINLYLDI